MKLNILKYNDLALTTIIIDDLHFKKLLKPGLNKKKKRKLKQDNN